MGNFEDDAIMRQNNVFFFSTNYAASMEKISQRGLLLLDSEHL